MRASLVQWLGFHPSIISERILERWRSVFDSRRLQKSSDAFFDYSFLGGGFLFFEGGGGFFGVSFCIVIVFFTVKGLMDGWMGEMGEVKEAG